jgi:ankyrin repeat protein
MKTREDDFVQIMQLLDLRSDVSGVCRGMALTGIKNFLIGNLANFAEDINLCNIHSKISYNTIKQLKSIELFHQPFYHRNLFGKAPSPNDIEAVASLLSDPKNKQDDMIRAGDFRMIYSNDELLLLCEVLNSVATTYAKKNKVNFAMFLDNRIHAIGLCYEYVKNNWIIIDSMPPFKQVAPKNLAAEIDASFDFDNNRGFETIIFSTRKNAAIIKEMVALLAENADFNKLHSITQEKALRQTFSGHTLAHFAAFSGKCNELKIIADLAKGVLKQKNIADETPAFLAAQNGHIAVLDLLYNEGIKLDDCITPDGWTLGHAAAETDQLNVIEWLEKKEIPYNTPDSKGWKPLHIVAKEGYMDIACFLLSKNKVLLDQKTTRGNTPEKIALKYHHHEMAQFFKKMRVTLPEKSNLASPSAMSCLSL